MAGRARLCGSGATGIARLGVKEGVSRQRHVSLEAASEGGSMATAVGTLSGGEFAGPIYLPDTYRPSNGEPFMGPRQIVYFRRKLHAWKNSILQEARETLVQLQADSLREPDITDRASSETDWSIELRTRDRQRKLIAKIDAALRRIDEGDYGYCEVTGEPISLARLEARPIATMTVEAQEKHERNEKISREE